MYHKERLIPGTRHRRLRALLALWMMATVAIFCLERSQDVPCIQQTALLYFPLFFHLADGTHRP